MYSLKERVGRNNKVMLCSICVPSSVGILEMPAECSSAKELPV